MSFMEQNSRATCNKYIYTYILTLSDKLKSSSTIYKFEIEEHISSQCYISLVLHLCRTDYARTGSNRNNELKFKNGQQFF